MLTSESVTFGKYKGLTLGHVLKDRQYCKWLLEQEWFREGYEYLFNRIKEYSPLDYFVKNDRRESDGFINSYKFFNLVKLDELELPLVSSEKECYNYYLEQISNLKSQIFERLENDEVNPYDIKAPTNWLNKFEMKYGIPREEFKAFLSSYDLPNLPYIIEDIKAEGNIEYKGAKSFIIAKTLSEKQEKWWESLLKSHFGEDLGAQFKFDSCIFDFLLISRNIIFECKLGLKDFSNDQHKKYKSALKSYRIIYLIGYDAVIDLESKLIFTLDKDKYQTYQDNIMLLKKRSFLDDLIVDFKVTKVDDFITYFDSIRIGDCPL